MTARRRRDALLRRIRSLEEQRGRGDWVAWFAESGGFARGLDDERAAVALQFFPLLVAEWRTTGREPHAFRFLCERLPLEAVLEHVDDDELFELTTTLMWCHSCRKRTPHLDRTLYLFGCIECCDMPALQHEVEHWRRHLEATLAPEARERVQRWLSQAEARLARIQLTSVDEDTAPWHT